MNIITAGNGGPREWQTLVMAGHHPSK